MSLTQDFVVFWQQYPRRIGKLAAQKAYEKARKRGVTQQQLLDGIAAYVKHKPEYADFCHPATWLNQGRWEDEYDAPKRSRLLGPEYPEGWADWCQHEPRCHNRTWHEAVLFRERQARGESA